MKKIISLVLVLAFVVLAIASCGNSVSEELTQAKELLYAMYKDEAVATPSDYKVVDTVKSAGVSYTVTWSVDVETGVVVGTSENHMVTIDVDEKTLTEINYVLTATISDAKGKSTTVSFNHSVPAYKVFTFDEYVAAANDSTVVVRGVISGIIAKSNGNSSNCLYLQDKDGGYYVYNMSQDPVTELNLAMGMEVEVTGIRSTYSGTYEITNASVEVLNATPAVATPVDFTDVIAAAESLKDATLTAKQSMLVTIKGVEITGIDASDASYYRFTAGGKSTYVRMSSSVCPIVAQKDAFTAEYNSHVGYVANVTGVICLYDGAFYLTPVTVDAIEYIGLPEKDDAGKVATEIEKVTVDAKVDEAKTVVLPTTGVVYSDVKIAWETTSPIATVTDAGLVITLPDADTTVTVKATFTCGSVVETKEYTIKVVAPATDLTEAEILEIAFALEAGEAMSGTQVLRGEIVEIPTVYSEQYNNVTVNIKVGDYIIQAFRLVGGADLKVGDVITVAGTIKNYKGTVEFDAKCTYSKDLTVEEVKMLLVCEKAFALEAGEALSGTQILRGEIVEIPTVYSEQYNNITVNIKVGDYIIQAFRLVGGADLKVGDVITVTGVIKNYKGTVEFDAKCTYITGSVEEAKMLKICAEAFALEVGESLSGTKTLTGEIVEIPTVYSEQYNNVTVNIKVGDYTIQAFRLVGGADLKVGDVITVTGVIKNYKGTVEFDAKCTYVVA